MILVSVAIVRRGAAFRTAHFAEVSGAFAFVALLSVCRTSVAICMSSVAAFAADVA